jgi:L-lactate dehydrogenase complex protein LldG
MSDARRTVYDRIKTALSDGTPDKVRRQAVADRIASPPKHPLPARTQHSAHDLREQFRSFLEGQSATVIDVATIDAIPATVANYLRDKNLALRLRMGTDPVLAKLPWHKEPALERLSGAAAGTDDAGLSVARAGVSETGTLVLTSGPDNPVTINFLPETHIVVLAESDIVGAYEHAWTKIRGHFGAGQMPRTVNFISGPSRTADIASKLVMGAHGPRRLCVILVRS